jgi:Transcriptional regulatory protein, C terminal/Protein of unknown function (DUF664)
MPDDEPDNAWQVPADLTATAVLDAYRREAELADATSLDSPPAWWPEDLFDSWRLDDLREILLHVIAETACHAGTPIGLAAKEFAILEYFMRHPGQVLSRARILEHVRDFTRDGDSNIVDVYVRILRQKIDRPFGTRSIETVRGVGYRLASRGTRLTS